MGKVESGLKCHWCAVWFHAGCEGVPQDLGRALADHPDQSVWLCRACQDGIKTSASKISKLERLNRELQEHIEGLAAKEERKGEEEVGDGGGGSGSGRGEEEERVVAAVSAGYSVAEGAGEHRPARVDLNVMKRNMAIAKGFLDISLLSANANQLKNVINFGDHESNLYYLVLTGIILSLILQVAAGVVLIVAERFDINNEEEQERGDYLNTVVTCLVFLVLIINVFVASLGVSVGSPHPLPPHHYDDHGPSIASSTSGVLKDHLGGT